MKFKIAFTTLILAGLNLYAPQESSAEKVCIKFQKSSQKITKKSVTSGNCPRGYITVVDTTTLTGAAGSSGAAGADGKLAIWGDGSDGDVTITDGTAFDHTKQYRNITVAAGTTVDLYPGQQIKCTGTLTIAGTIYVQYRNAGSFIQPLDGSTYFPAHSNPQLGLAYSEAENGECATSPSIGDGGGGGVGFGGSVARLPTKITNSDFSGGGGASSSGVGGQSAGAIGLYCKQGITISSSGVLSNVGGAGVNGGGGAGGGIIILASNGTITQAGLIDVSGGAGGNSTTSSCAGGGGGGGFIHFIAPTVVNTGTNTVSGGSIGTNGTAVTASPRCGGGGGGGSYGGGGQGYRVDAANSCGAGAVSNPGGTRTTSPTGGSVEALLF